MGNEIMLGAYGQPRSNRGVLARATKAERALQQRESLEAATLLYEARRQEAVAMLRKRMSEAALYDIRDVGELAANLAGEDRFFAAMLVPIVEEFSRQTAQDIRSFNNGLSF